MPGLGSPTGAKTWRRIVTTEYEGAGRWRAYCGDLGVWSGETVHFRHIRFLPEVYRAMPFQALLAQLPVEPMDEETGKYSTKTFKFLADELRAASSLNVCVGEIVEREEAWPRVLMTLSSMMKEEKEECIVRALVKKKLAKMRAK